VNGLATYSTLPTPPLERILLETDAPFLTPEPFRGIINEPGYIKEIAQWLSDKLGVEFETIERETTQNAERLYRFQDTKPTESIGE
jgi:TatD DNase family protein